MAPNPSVSGWSRFSHLDLAGGTTVILPGQRALQGCLMGLEWTVTTGAGAQTITFDWYNGLFAHRIRRYVLPTTATTSDELTPCWVPAWVRHDTHEDGTADAALTYAATTVTDTRVNWQINRFAGHVVRAGASTGVVTSNTATVLTIPSWDGGTPTNLAGKPGYTIRPPDKTATDQGTASNSGATSLTDATKTWTANAYVGRMVYAAHNWQNGIVSRGMILSNTGTVLTVASWEGGTPSTSAIYVIDEVACSLRATVTAGGAVPTFAEALAWGVFHPNGGGHYATTPP